MALPIMMFYHTVAGMLLPVNDPAVDAILEKARAQVGEAPWKRGFSGMEKDGPTEIVRAMLAAAGFKPQPVKGAISGISFAKTGDRAGNNYEKVRIGFESDAGDYLISLEASSEITQRLAQKLLNAQPGEELTFLPFSTLVNKHGRTFANHAVSLKRADGSEVQAPPNLWTEAQAQADAAEAALKTAGITQKEVVNKAKANKKVEFHLALYREKIRPMFEQSPVPA